MVIIVSLVSLVYLITSSCINEPQVEEHGNVQSAHTILTSRPINSYEKNSSKNATEKMTNFINNTEVVTFSTVSNDKPVVYHEKKIVIMTYERKTTKSPERNDEDEESTPAYVIIAVVASMCLIMALLVILMLAYKLRDQYHR